MNHFLDDEDWALGLGIPTMDELHSSRERFRGEEQALLTVDELEENQNFVDEYCHSNGGMVVGVDNRVYEPRFGLIQCFAPAKVGKDSPKVYVDEIDWDSFPPDDELAYLFDVFFSHYDREALMLVGRKRDGSGWLYYVPEQEATCGGVEWKADDEEMGEFLDVAKWVGTIHIHPGSCCSPSNTDVNDWAEPEKSGLHLIFGRDGSYTVSGAIAGKTFPLMSDTIVGARRQPVEYTTSKGRTLEELLKKPKPVVVKRKKRWPPDRRFPGRTAAIVVGQPGWPTQIALPDNDAGDLFTDCCLERVGALPVEIGEMGNLRVVLHDGQHYIMTADQYEELGVKHNGETKVPTASILRIRPVRRDN